MDAIITIKAVEEKRAALAGLGQAELFSVTLDALVKNGPTEDGFSFCS